MVPAGGPVGLSRAEWLETERATGGISERIPLGGSFCHWANDPPLSLGSRLTRDWGRDVVSLRSTEQPVGIPSSNCYQVPGKGGSGTSGLQDVGRCPQVGSLYISTPWSFPAPTILYDGTHYTLPIVLCIPLITPRGGPFISALPSGLPSEAIRARLPMGLPAGSVTPGQPPAPSWADPGPGAGPPRGNTG